MRKIALSLGCAAMLGTASTSFGALGVIINEDFESYADTGAMSAVWAGFDGVLANEIDDDQDLIPEVTGIGNFAFHPGGSVNELTLGAPVIPTVDEWVKLSVDIYDNDTSLDPLFPLNPGNKRMSLGMRNSTTVENLLEMGMYNTLDGQYQFRTVLFPGSAYTPVAPTPALAAQNWGEWITAQEDPPATNSFDGGRWNRFIATITPDTITFELDLDRDGTVDFKDTYTDVLTSANGFTHLRFGGVSGLSSGGGGATFDNILLEIVEAETALVGDLNGDGFVGIDDLSIVLGNWNQNVPPADPLADPSGDGFVGIDDLNQVLGNWNAGTPPTAGAAVPEPATLALLGLGGVAVLRRR